jgi:hypothetical protein
VVRAVTRPTRPTSAATDEHIAAAEAEKPARSVRTKAQSDQAAVSARAAEKKAKVGTTPSAGRRSQYKPGICHHRDSAGQADCDKPLIRATALCCEEHEKEYREAAKLRKLARDEAAGIAPKATKPTKVAKPAAKAAAKAPAKAVRRKA